MKIIQQNYTHIDRSNSLFPACEELINYIYLAIIYSKISLNIFVSSTPIRKASILSNFINNPSKARTKERQRFYNTPTVYSVCCSFFLSAFQICGVSPKQQPLSMQKTRSAGHRVRALKHRLSAQKSTLEELSPRELK